MNNLMVDGKKSIAEKIVYNALDRVEGSLNVHRLRYFMKPWIISSLQ
jgi:small subunit ribosomal protein S7